MFDINFTQKTTNVSQNGVNSNTQRSQINITVSTNSIYSLQNCELKFHSISEQLYLRTYDFEHGKLDIAYLTHSWYDQAKKKNQYYTVENNAKTNKTWNQNHIIIFNTNSHIAST